MLRIRYIIIVLLPLIVSAQGLVERQTGSRNFLVHHNPSVPGETVQRIIEQLESDYQEFRHYFNLTVPGRTPVFIHNDMSSFQSATLAYHYETATVYNDEIHLAPLSHIRASATLSSVITQQAIRLVLYSRRMNGCPRWLYEGASAYFAGIHRLQAPPGHLSVQRPSDLDEIFAHAHNEAEFVNGIYVAALSFKSILERYGEAHTVTLLRLFNGEFVYEEAVPYSLGVTLERFERQWRRDVETLLTEFRENRGR